MNHRILREFLAEFLGTFILIIFGVGVVAQTVLSGAQNGNHLSIHLGWGLAVTMAVYVAGNISGAHLNPAVTLAFAVFKKFPWKKVIPYVFGQFLGALVASLVVYFVYFEALNHFDGGFREITGPLGTAGIWATYPQPFLSTFPGGFVDQTLGTLLLVFLIFALSDRHDVSPSLAPILVGSAVVLIGMTFGFNSGYAINPARDLAPRLFTALAGWGKDVFISHQYWWWVPVTAPCFGGLLGGGLYQILAHKPHASKVSLNAP